MLQVELRRIMCPLTHTVLECFILCSLNSIKIHFRVCLFLTNTNIMHIKILTSAIELFILVFCHWRILFLQYGSILDQYWVKLWPKELNLIWLWGSCTTPHKQYLFHHLKFLWYGAKENMLRNADGFALIHLVVQTHAYGRWVYLLYCVLRPCSLPLSSWPCSTWQETVMVSCG